MLIERNVAKKITLICIKNEVPILEDDIMFEDTKFYLYDKLTIGETYEGTYDVRRAISSNLSDLDVSIDEGYWVEIEETTNMSIWVHSIAGSTATPMYVAYKLPHFFPKELFITLAEWRDKQINDILE
jgi:hypothetical protein